MKKCKMCGGDCTSLGGGRYECSCCGNVFSEDDFISIQDKAVIEAAKVKAAEEARARVAVEQARAQAASADAGVELFEKVVGGVLEIICNDGSAAWCGSGYLLTKDGYAITNAHVVLNQKGGFPAQCKVRIAGETVSASVLATGTRDSKQFVTPLDLALIKLSRVPSSAVTVKFADFTKVRTGQRMFIIGNSLGDGTCITNGIVSDKCRDGLMMHDCAQNGGNSGGPAFNAKGCVIGTNVGGRLNNGSRAEGMNYSIPSDATINFIEKTGYNVVFGME